jgi:hypothetical protein
MVELSDSGCGQHPPRNFQLSDSIAQLVCQLVANLPAKGGWATFICEYGHTHCLKIQLGGDARTRSERRPAGSPRALVATPF